MVWTLFTLALVGWWMIFTVSQLEKMRTGQLFDPSIYLQQERMIKAEGGVLLILLFSGGVGLVLALWQLQRQHEKIRTFFSVFTHEIKTSLARLILKSDLLAEEHPHENAFQTLKEETMILQNQLENALWVAKGFGELFVEKLPWKRLIGDFEIVTPNLKWIYLGDNFDVKVDRRVFQMIMRNLIQNSLVHGQASEMKCKAELLSSKWVLSLEDNGKSFSGDFSGLGAAMQRVAPSSGSGIGLWVVRQGVEKLGGTIQFYAVNGGGFGIRMEWPRESNHG